MQPMLYKKILKLIETKNLKTITVDIFDTILLSDYWPEELCRYQLAEQWLCDLCRITGLQVTSYELFDLYRQAKNDARAAGRPMQIDLILDAMLDLLCAKYTIQLSSDDRLQLLAIMIATDIQFRINNACPNHNLIATLKSVKEIHPEIKLYFVTDTTLFTEQIKTILQIFDIKIFDDGVSSSDLCCEKRTGKMYEALGDKLPFDFDLMYNLHIGDSRVADYLMPILHDSTAIHYRPIRMRGLRTLVGNIAMRIIKVSAINREQKRYQQLSSIGASAGSEWKQYGALIGQVYRIWASQINLRAELNSEVTYLLVKGLNDLNITRGNVLNTTLDKKSMVKAYVWLLATFETSRWDAVKLLQAVMHEVGIKDRSELYKICFGNNHVTSELAVKTFGEAEFYQEFLAEIKAAGADIVDSLRQNYEDILGLLSRSGKICVVEKTDDNTVMLFREFARLHGVSNDITEWILDADGGVSSVERKVEVSLNARRLKRVMRGKQNATAVLRQTELTPTEYMQRILLPELKRVGKSLG